MHCLFCLIFSHSSSLLCVKTSFANGKYYGKCIEHNLLSWLDILVVWLLDTPLQGASLCEQRTSYLWLFIWGRVQKSRISVEEVWKHCFPKESAWFISPQSLGESEPHVQCGEFLLFFFLPIKNSRHLKIVFVVELTIFLSVVASDFFFF